MIQMWTNGTDYLYAESASSAIGHAMEQAGLTEADLGGPSEWKAESLDTVRRWTDEETGEAHEMADRDILIMLEEKNQSFPYYWHSDEW